MTASLLFTSLTALGPISYIIVFLGMILEGDIVLFTTAFLTKQGLFDSGDIIFTVITGVLLGDYLWFWAGAHPNFLPAFLKRWVTSVSEPFDEHLKQSPAYTIFISKFTYGFNKIILVRAGMLNIPIQSVIKNYLLSLILWMLIIGSIGYFAGFSFILIKKYVRFAEITLFASLAIFIIAWKLISRRAKKRL
ncbi:MAG: hypothetical protein Q8P76_01015 [bacterium]|nr:hypothetical protein [bacterium]